MAEKNLRRSSWKRILLFIFLGVVAVILLGFATMARTSTNSYCLS
jgi:hypothetical protein